MKNSLPQKPTWMRKTLQGSLCHFLYENCPQLGGKLTIEPVVTKIMELVDHFLPPTDRMRPGQVLWYGIDENETSGYGKKIEDCNIKPAILDLIGITDLDDFLNKIPKKQRQIKTAIRLFTQAYEQGSVLTHSDVSVLMRLSPGTISRYIKGYENETGNMVPRRGNIHDMGPTLTHKSIICRKHLKEGLSIEQTAKATNHCTQSVVRYTGDFKRVKECLDEGWPPSKISFATGLSKSLVQEYIDLINEDH